MSTAPIIGLLLAAGLGSRYRAVSGRHKLLEAVPEGLPGAGMPLALCAARALLAGTHAVLAIVRPEDERLAGLLAAAGCEVLDFASPGLGASLAFGVCARADAGGWLVLPADLPFVRPSTVQAVRAALATSPCAAPAYRNRRGHPVGFGTQHYAALAALKGDRGARALLETQGWQRIEVDDPGCVADIDVPADLQACLRAPDAAAWGVQAADRVVRKPEG